jgi:hypothetical protein
VKKRGKAGGVDPARLRDLVRVRRDSDLARRESDDDVVDLVLPPQIIARSPVVDAGEEVEARLRDLLGWYAELLEELATRRVANAVDAVDLGGDVERVGAAGVGPEVRERHLLCGALLEQETTFLIKHEDRERGESLDGGENGDGSLGARSPEE